MHGAQNTKDTKMHGAQRHKIYNPDMTLQTRQIQILQNKQKQRKI